MKLKNSIKIILLTDLDEDEVEDITLSEQLDIIYFTADSVVRNWVIEQRNDRSFLIHAFNDFVNAKKYFDDISPLWEITVIATTYCGKQFTILDHYEKGTQE